MVQKIVQGVLDVMNPVLHGWRPCRDDKNVVECLGAEIVFLSPHLHRDRAVIVAPAAVAPSLATEPKAGEHPRELRYLAVAISGDGLAQGIKLTRAILVELPQTDREKLLHFPRVVF